jgi:hypothetical protein
VVHQQAVQVEVAEQVDLLVIMVQVETQLPVEILEQQVQVVPAV